MSSGDLPVLTDTITPLSDDIMTKASTAAFFGGIITDWLIEPYMRWVQSWQYGSDQVQKPSPMTKQNRCHSMAIMSSRKRSQLKLKTMASNEKLRLSWLFSLASEKYTTRNVYNGQKSFGENLTSKRLGYFLDEMMWSKQSFII